MSHEELPGMDYKRYRLTAVIDWLQFSIKTQSPTNFQTIKRHCGLSYVEPLDKSAGGSATEFQFRLYDVQSWLHVKRCIDDIAEQFPLEDPPVITGVEIALDAYSKYGVEEDLVRMAAHFYKYLANPVSHNRRLGSKSTSGFSAEIWHRDVIQHFKEGDTAYIGNRHDNLSQRIYYKTTDKEVLLDQHEYRARVEITIMHDACPFKNIPEAEQYQLTKLARWFKFRRIREQLDGLSRKVAEEKAISGLVTPMRRAGGGIRMNAKSTKADQVLGDKAYDALRNLDRKLKRNVRKNRFGNS